jgi:hypothetical protein
LRKGQQQIGQIALGVDHNSRNPINGCFLKKTDTEAGFSASGHPHTNRMRNQILGVIQQPARFELFLCQIIGTTKVEDPELLEFLHGPSFFALCPPANSR